jgi:hypothetical protein
MVRKSVKRRISADYVIATEKFMGRVNPRNGLDAERVCATWIIPGKRLPATWEIARRNIIRFDYWLQQRYPGARLNSIVRIKQIIADDNGYH